MPFDSGCGDCFSFGVQREGFGILTFADGARYVGSFKAGLCEGKGILTFPGALAVGFLLLCVSLFSLPLVYCSVFSFVCSLTNHLFAHAHKLVLCLLPHPLADNSKYEGDFVGGKYHGFGEYTRADGMKFQGQFQGGQVDGR